MAQGREVSTDLQNLLDAASCRTTTTLELTLTNESVIRMSTGDGVLTIDGNDYQPDLRVISDLKQSIFSPPDRCTVGIQNVDKLFGGQVDGELLTHAIAIVGRYYEDEHGVLPSVWVELFQGEAFPTDLDEGQATLEVLADLVAAGYCIASWTLAPPCQVAVNSPECGLTGATCNKKRRSPGGCQGNNNEEHFVGMEYPDPVVPEAPAGGGGVGGDDPPTTGGGGGGYQPPCPRVDQYVLVEGSDGQPKAKLAGQLSIKDRVFMPTTETFHKLASVAIVPDEEIWLIVGDNGATCYSSSMHPIIRTERDETGTPIEIMHAGYSMLTVRKGRTEQTVARLVSEQPKRAAVVRIKMVDGHIYAAGNTPSLFVVAHNSKLPPHFDDL
ncbi:MAG TPA: hypothetical protein VGO43_09685 [Pyrinomonadaceae bacterium]|jgi:hypothetical protein|nr:hypothetical protein [Pyrinomonadaceae bacterium]